IVRFVFTTSSDSGDCLITVNGGSESIYTESCTDTLNFFCSSNVVASARVLPFTSVTAKVSLCFVIDPSEKKKTKMITRRSAITTNRFIAKGRNVRNLNINNCFGLYGLIPAFFYQCCIKLFQRPPHRFYLLRHKAGSTLPGHGIHFKHKWLAFFFVVNKIYSYHTPAV